MEKYGRSCTKCKAFKSLVDFYKDRRGKFGRASVCKECSDKRRAEWGERNKDHVTQRNRNYYLANKEEAQFYKLRRKYGISKEQYTAMFDAQQGKCVLCGTDDPGRGDRRRTLFSVDHDHTTGKVRGLLCILCNTGLGALNDSPDLLRKAALYLEQRSENGDHRAERGVALDNTQSSLSSRNGGENLLQI